MVANQRRTEVSGECHMFETLQWEMTKWALELQAICYQPGGKQLLSVEWQNEDIPVTSVIYCSEDKCHVMRFFFKCQSCHDVTT